MRTLSARTTVYTFHHTAHPLAFNEHGNEVAEFINSNDVKQNKKTKEKAKISTR
jgi:hypothetical protein